MSKERLELKYKKLDFKQILILVFIGCCQLCYSQKSLKSFEGEFLFKESYYYLPITRIIYDTANLFYSYSITNSLQIERVVLTKGYNSDSDNKSFLPIIFYKNGDSLFYKYQEKYSDVPDTVITKLFPLSFKDTIEVPYCYRISEDSIRGSGINSPLVIKTDCDGDERVIKTYRLKDTSFIFKEYTLECYQFEQKARCYHDVFFTRKILVEKNTLIPVDVKEYNFHINRPRFRHKIYTLQGQNLLTIHKKLISID